MNSHSRNTISLFASCDFIDKTAMQIPIVCHYTALLRASDGEILCLDVGKNGLSQEPLIEKF